MNQVRHHQMSASTLRSLMAIAAFHRAALLTSGLDLPMQTLSHLQQHRQRMDQYLVSPAVRGGVRAASINGEGGRPPGAPVAAPPAPQPTQFQVPPVPSACMLCVYVHGAANGLSNANVWLQLTTPVGSCWFLDEAGASYATKNNPWAEEDENI